MSSILFYNPAGHYGCFSNFSRHKVFLKGKWWSTSEHYFQAQKFSGTWHEEDIRKSKTPGRAASMGRSRKRPLRKDWERVKDRVMLEVLRAKFTQHESLRTTLLETESNTLVEHTSRDAYWGDGGNGHGRNMLGKLLMQVRSELLDTSG